MKLHNLHRRTGKILWLDLKDYDISILHLEYIELVELTLKTNKMQNVKHYN